MRIFIVDDEPSIVEMLAKVCTESGNQVTSASSSRDALDYLNKNPVDLLIIDVAMPAPDGLQIMREARGAQPNLMILAMTGHQSRHPVSDVQAVGATDLIYKPLRLDEFRARVAFADQRRRLIEGLSAKRRELQQTSATMIKALQDELEDVRKSLRAARGNNGRTATEDTRERPDSGR